MNYLPLARSFSSKFKCASSAGSLVYFQVELGGPGVILGGQLAGLPFDEVDLILFAVEL